MPSEWNMFVKKIYEEGKAKDPNYEFKQALIDGSKRKSEMGRASASGVKSKKSKSKRSKSRSRKSSLSMTGGKKSRKNSRRSRR
jgi:hypothetical protein